MIENMLQYNQNLKEEGVFSNDMQCNSIYW